MNLFNSSNNITLNRLITFLFCVLFANFSNAQFIDNYKGQIKKDMAFFNPKTIKNKEIKKIEVTFFEKQALKGIHQTRGKVKQYSFDETGRITRLFFTEKVNRRRVTNVEWRAYKRNRLVSIKKGSDRNIKTKSIFYDDNKPSINIFGTAKNRSHNPKILIQKNYKEESAEYINYRLSENGDSITEWSNTSQTVHKSLILSKKNNSIKETICFSSETKECSSFEYNYKDNLLSKMAFKNSESEEYYYTFFYNSSQELIRCNKFRTIDNIEIEVSELLYEERTGNLQAIVTKNKITNFIDIRKFKYTYF